MNKLLSILPSFLISTLIFSSVFVEAQQERRFGFGFVGIGGLAVQGYTADQFFNGYFLTPPYPSTVHFMITAQSNEFVQQLYRDFMSTMMTGSAQYPNIKLGLHVAFNTSNEQRWTEFTSFLDFLANHPNSSTIGFVGFTVEQWAAVDPPCASSPSCTDTAFDRAKNLITSRGWPFVNYYPQGYKGTKFSSYQWMVHTNYPNGDHQATLDFGLTPEYVGNTVGTDGCRIFPSPGCNPQGNPEFSLASFAQGFLNTSCVNCNLAACNNILNSSGFPPSIRQILSRDATNPLANRQWNFFVAGISCSRHFDDAAPRVPFIGVSGKTDTLPLWDNAVFRNEINQWLLENPGVVLQGAIPVSKIKFSGLLRNSTGYPLTGALSVFLPGIKSIFNSSSISGNYEVSVDSGIYDVQYNISNIFIPNFFAEIYSLDVSTDNFNPLYQLTVNSSTNRTTLIFNLTSSKIVEVFSPVNATQVLRNGTAIDFSYNETTRILNFTT